MYNTETDNTETDSGPSTMTITVNMDNAAFDYERAVEVVRILESLKRRVRDYGLEDQSIRDVNGNTVGKLELS